MRDVDDYRDEGIRDAAGAQALATAAAHLLEGNLDSHEVLQTCAYLLHQAGKAADNAALMFRLSEQPAPAPSADNEPSAG